MGSIFKDDAKPTKTNLVQIGRVINDTLDEALAINQKLDEFQSTLKNIVDENVLFVSTKILQEALEEVQLTIGKLELKESLKK